jgi:hypothetical protein
MRSNLEIVQQHYTASARGDLAGMLADVAANVEWKEMDGAPCAGVYLGARAVTEGVFARIGREWEGFAFELERLYDAGDTIFAAGWYSGRYRKTGKWFRCRTLHVWHLQGGTIRKFEQFADTQLMATATR